MYDPMIGKLIVWDTDREQATRRMVRALAEYEIGELKTLLPFHKAILQTDQWAHAETCRDLIEDRAWLKTLAFPKVEKPAEGEPTKLEQQYTVEVSGKRFDVKVMGSAAAAGAGGTQAGGSGPRFPWRRPNPPAGAQALRPSGLRRQWPQRRHAQPPRCRAPSSRSRSSRAQTVEEGDLICVIEAMKMENEITAHKSGVVVPSCRSPSVPRCRPATRSP